MKILIVSPIDPDAIEVLQSKYDVVCVFNPSKERLEELIADREVLIFRSGVNINAGLMEQAPNLGLLIRAGSGIDNLDVDYVKERGLKLVRVPEPGAKAVAEMTFAMFLALSRKLFDADRSMRQARWAKYELSGYLLTGKMLGIVGAGNIGSRVGRMGAAWGMNVIACDENNSAEFSNKLRKENIRLTSFDEVINSSDYISLHTPLNDSTRHMFGQEVFSRMKPGAFLVNIARGGVVDEEALYQELTDAGKLGGAGLDVHENEGEGKLSPLAKLPNVILTPHIGAMTIDSQHEIGLRVIEESQIFAKFKEDLA